jgi:4-hydroxy 2-oxovalerate aldolase
MGKIKLLDCTLRDGGYVNEWKFGYDCIRDICKEAVNSHVENKLIGIGLISASI